MRQRLAVARAFLHEPSVLLLDEPFTALDDRAIAVLQRLLREALAAGKTIVMSTHQLREALELATHVALLNRGQVAFHGPRTPEMVADPGYVYARYGEGVMSFFRQIWVSHRQGPARRASHQGGHQRLARLRAGDPAAVQLRLRSRRRKRCARSPAACCGSSSPSPAR